jgi:hypothetical protein
VDPTIKNQNNVTVNPEIKADIKVISPPAPEPKMKIEAKYTVCISGERGMCPQGALYLDCSRFRDGIAGWAKKECGKYIANVVKSYSGGGCGTAIVEIKCIASE